MNPVKANQQQSSLKLDIVKPFGINLKLFYPDIGHWVFDKLMQ